MRRKLRIRTDVPTLWLSETNILRIIWPNGIVWILNCCYLGNNKWDHSIFSGKRGTDWLRAKCYYCGPLFISKENEP